MKRILCAMLTAILVLAFCSSASATEYTHPTAGFHLTVPEGWLAIDSSNVVEMINSSRVSADMAATLSYISPILDSAACVYLFKEDVVSPPFVNIAVDDKGDVGFEITLDDLLATARAYEANYLEDQERFPGYTASAPAGAEQVEGCYPMGYLGGVYEQGGYRIALAQVLVAVGTRLYEFTLTAQEDKASEAESDFGNLVGGFAAQKSAGEAGGAKADETVLARGAELMEAEDFEGALAHFDAAIADHGDVAKYHDGRGEALFMLERYQEVVDAFSKAIELDADFWEYYSDRGAAYFCMASWDNALADFQKAVNLDAAGEDAYISLSYLQRELEHAEASVLTCTSGLAIYPESEDLWGILGDAQFDLSHYSEAVAAYDEMLALANGAYTAEDITNYATAKERAGTPPVPGTPAEPDDILGTWRLSSVEIMGATMDSSALGMEITMELNADSTALLHSSTDGDMPGTWAIRDGQVLVTAKDGTDILLTRLDGNLCGELGGAAAVFTKGKVDGDGSASGLSPYFPADRITLPEGSKVIGVFEGETGEYSAGDYIEITEVQLPLAKTESIEYFTKMLNRGDEDFFETTEEAWFLPEAITIAYPDVTNDSKISASYTHSRGVRDITVHLFIKGNEETVYTAYIEVTYSKDPSLPTVTPAELSIASLRQAFADMNYWTSEGAIPAMVVGDLEPVDGFEMNYEPNSKGAWVNIIFIEFKDDADLQRYAEYREGYANSTAFGLVYVEYSENTEEVIHFIEDVVKAAGG